MSKWRICPRCDGEGQSSAYLGTYTADEMNEEGPEFQEDYIAGKYDRPCEECGGSGKVTQEDEESFDQRRADLRLQWQEDGCPEGSFSAWSGL